MTMPLVLTNALPAAGSEAAGPEAEGQSASFKTRKARLVFQPVDAVLPSLGQSVPACA
ncbi:MAG: hypothetical protein N2Z62_04790 [Rhodobacteraceae bacterium]|nr:hypothetical protein [Paracoccaceae bacterium]